MADNSLRRITDQQFSDGTTIDGNRIDAAIEDMVDRVNNVPLGDLRKRYVPVTYAMGWSPPKLSSSTTTGAGLFPFLDSRNDDTQVLGTIPEAGVQNLYRVKGIRMPGIDPENTDYRLSQLVWTTALYFREPVILRDVTLILHLDHPDATGWPTYKNTYTYGNPPPAGFSIKDDSKDVALVVHVDSPFRSEDRSLNTVEVIKTNFTVNHEPISEIPHDVIPPGDFAFNNAFPGGGLHGRLIRCANVNSPIRANARVRLAVAIPLPNSNVFEHDWGSNPPCAQAYSLSATFLELLES